MNKRSVYNYKLTCVLVLLFLFSSKVLAYCDSSSSNSSIMWIERVSVGDHVNFSEGSPYSDFTEQSIALDVGASAVVLTPAFSSFQYTVYWNIWVDFDGDNEFSDDEVVFSASSKSPVFGDIIIPSGAANKVMTMRVSMAYGAYSEPCDSFSYGEVEDYVISVTSAPIDNTPPGLIGTAPLPAENDIGISSSVTLMLDESVNSSDVTGWEFSLESELGPVDGYLSLSANATEIFFTPYSDLAFSTEYSAHFIGELRDDQSNSQMVELQWSFTTEENPDQSPPAILNFFPADGDVRVGVTRRLQIGFSEAVNADSLNLDTVLISDGETLLPFSVEMARNTVYIGIDQKLSYSTEYTVTLTSEIEDLAGNKMGEDHSWSFTTEEFQPDYCSLFAVSYGVWTKAFKLKNYSWVSQSAPGSGYHDATNTIFSVSRGSSNAFSFTPDFTYSSFGANLRIYVDWDKNGVFSPNEEVFYGSGSGMIDGDFKAPADAVSGTTRMRVQISKYNFPYPCGKISDGHVVDFSVNVPETHFDYTRPKVLSTIPQEGQAEVSENSSIAVYFSELMDKTTINSESVSLIGDDGPVDVDVFYSSKENAAFISPVSNLQPGVQYSVLLASSISDYSGLNLLEDVSWVFHTGEIEQPSSKIGGIISYSGEKVDQVLLAVSSESESFVTSSKLDQSYEVFPVPSGEYLIRPHKEGYLFEPESMLVGLEAENDFTSANFFARPEFNIVNNGDFDYPSLIEFEYADKDGESDAYFRNFDTNNDGILSSSYMFHVGGKYLAYPGTLQRGGALLKQTVTLVDGSVYFSMDIATKASANKSADRQVSVFFNGEHMDSHMFGSLSSGETEHSNLEFEVPSVNAGEHVLEIYVTSLYLKSTGLSTYLDNIRLWGSSTNLDPVKK